MLPDQTLFKEYTDVVNVKQLCEMLGGICSKTACQLLRTSKIQRFKIGNRYFIPKIFVLNYICNLQNRNL